MLKTLSIKNYAIIDNLTIDFEKDFNVFTGETGAGKSIIVGALSFLLKGRSDSSIIKSGKDKAIIEGVFSIDNQELINTLKQQDIDVEDEIIVKRVISNDNHNSIKINESNVTLGFLTELFSDVIDIHSQKDNHYLFNRRNQLLLLDKYANNKSLLDEYTDKYNSYIRLKNEYEDLLNNTYNETEIEYLKFDYNELNEADLSLEEEKDLEAKESRYKASEKYITTLSEAVGLYDNNYGIKENLHSLINTLNLDDEQVINISSNIKNLYYELDENLSKLKDILASFNDSDFNIEQIEERLYTYAKLKRKHKTDTNGLLELKDNIKAKIDSFDDRDRVLTEKKNQLDNELKELDVIANKLHDIRLESATSLAKEVIQESNDLLLNNINFEINFNDVEYNMLGKDEIEFMVSLNKGEDLKPLRNVASGGEISRLMLALKVVFAKLSNTDLLILDEIDTGVSGKVALKVGEKIAKISNNLQVLCISHLAPVAACADHHYLIFKEDNEAYTYTNVKKLNNQEIIEQLAIISNTSTDNAALTAAQELYDSSQKLVNENR